jgi:hypothetical protein
VTLTPVMTRLLADVQVRAPGALDDAIKREFFTLLEEFFKTTSVWREDIPVSVESGTTSYELVPTGASLINKLMWVFDNSQIQVAATMSEPGTMVLKNAPSQSAEWTATVCLSVKDPADRDSIPQFPAWILERYRVDFLDGLVGRLLAQPAKPYSNQPLSVFHLRRWRSAMAVARSEAQRNNVFRAQAWRFPQAFATRTRR